MDQSGFHAHLFNFISSSQVLKTHCGDPSDSIALVALPEPDRLGTTRPHSARLGWIRQLPPARRSLALIQHRRFVAFMFRRMQNISSPIKNEGKNDRNKRFKSDFHFYKVVILWMEYRVTCWGSDIRWCLRWVHIGTGCFMSNTDF